ncbi:SCAMP family [Leishmania donovani]|uniref:SCAMP family protein n=1 Tax=Leishmania donovani TaxID=5661 RepID=A0A504XN84_LEIDO|nr:SCAMP family protein [Leishmania donovani]CAJ1989395.1 SCAMP family [Leishmania donovani]VDZ45262.1 SCAMP_family_putative/Pfam:PF04144 [Leishmania donovani]
MFQGSSETQELRALYNFEPESANNDRNGALRAQTPQQASGGDSGDGESAISGAAIYSPREEQSYESPTSPAAFGTRGDVSVTIAVTPGGDTVTKTKTKVSKTGVLKEVFGVNRKSTKGMTEEQKKTVNLEQRWQNALLEEQRLNDLEQRISREEAVTAELGQTPNFPRKFLCIHPLVYHSFSTVPEHRQLFVKMAFWDWVAVCILLVANCGIAIGVSSAPVRSKVVVHADINKVQNGVLAIVHLTGIPLSFLIWYWRIYQGCSTGRPPQHILALSGLFVALAHAIFALAGPKNYGLCGIALAKWIQATRESGVVAPVAIMAVLWAAQAVFTGFMIFRVFVFYRRDLAARRAARRYGMNVVG